MLQIKNVGANDGTRVYSSTQAKSVEKNLQMKNCHKIGRDKGIQLCSEWRPYNYVLRTIDTEENWRATNEGQFRVRYFRTAERHFRTREGKGRGPKNDRNPNAPTWEDVHQKWTQRC